VGSNAEYEKNRYFRPISRFISEMIQNRVIIPVENQYELYCIVYLIYRMVQFSVTLNE